MVKKKEGFSLYKLLTTLGMLGVFLAVGYIVFQFSYGHINALQILITALIFIVSAGCLLCLPWAKWITEKRYKIVSWVFIGIISVTILLWFISAILIYRILIVQQSDGAKAFKLLNFLKVVFIISCQTLLANMIGRTFLTYKKNLIVFQAVMYLSYLFLDFYVSVLIGSVGISSSNGFSPPSDAVLRVLLNKFVLTLLTLSILYIAISNAILRVVRRRGVRKGGLGEAFADAEEDNDAINLKPSKSAEEKLAELKTMLDKNLITQEEYDKKRKDIIDHM